MVAVVSGNSLGLLNTSRYVLGSDGASGQAAQGRAGEQVYVNAATGNLVIQNRDELVIGRGPDLSLLRTYNSQGQLDGDNNDNWRIGVYRKVFGLTGTANVAGSTVKRVAEDGSESTWAFDTGSGKYSSTDGGGAFDTLAFDSAAQTWTWTDGDSQVTERYDWPNGRLIQLIDADLNSLTFAYDAAGLITQVTDAGGERTFLDYSGNNLTRVRTVNAAGETVVRTRYIYDTSNRLTQVVTDLSPTITVAGTTTVATAPTEADIAAAIADGKVYSVTYAYDGTSKRVASIAQSDGNNVSFIYTLDGRLASYTDANGKVTNISYTQGTANLQTSANANSTALSTTDTQTVTTTVPPYYTVINTDTWSSITQKVYGTSQANAVAALQAAMGNPVLAAGLTLTVPPTLTYNVSTGSAANAAVLSTTVTSTVAPYYTVPPGNTTWASIAQAVYGTSDPGAASALQAALGNPALTAGLKLTVPQTLNYTATVTAAAISAALSTTVTTTSTYNLNASALTAPTAGGWAAAALVAGSSTVSATAPQIKFDQNGNGMAVWALGADLFYSLYTKTSDSWSAAATLDGALTGSPLSPHLSMSANGNALVTWIQNGNVYARRYVGGVWDGATTIPNLKSGTTAAAAPVGAINDSGGAVVAYTQLTTLGGSGVRVNVYNGTAWQVATGLSGTSFVTSFSIAIDSLNNATLVWSLAASGFYSSRYSASAGTWSSPNNTLFDATTASVTAASIAFQGNGDGIVTWVNGGTLFTKSYVRSTDSWSATATTLGTGVSGLPNLSLSANGNGLVTWLDGSGNVFARRYAAGAWLGSGPEAVESAAGVASSPTGSINDAGQAAVVFVQANGTVNDVLANRFAGGAWQTAAPIESSTNSVGTLPASVAIDAQGNIGTVWLQKNGTQTTDSVYRNRYTTPVVTGAWGATPALVADSAADSAREPQVKFDQAGNGLAVWALGMDLFYSVYTKSTDTWSAAATLDGTLAGMPATIHLSMSASGNGLVAWGQSGALYARRYIGGVWDAVTAIPGPDGTVANATAVGAINDSGRAVLAFVQFSGITSNVYVNVYNGSAWQAAATGLDDLGAGNANPINVGPGVAIDALNNATVIWTQTVGTTDTLFFSRYTAATGSWSVPDGTLFGNPNGVYGPSLAFDGNGNGVAVWFNGGTVYSKSYTRSTNSWSASATVVGTGATSMPQLSMAASGDGLVTWSGLGTIMARRYAAGAWVGSAPEVIEGASGISVSSPVGAINGAGQAVIVFVTTARDVLARRLANGAWQAATVIESNANPVDEAMVASVAIDALGNIGTVWQQKNGAQETLSLYRNQFKTGTQYYVVPTGGATWDSIAQALYGSSAAASALQSALGNPPLVAGNQLTGFPPTLMVNTTATVAPYYTVLQTDTWTSITQKVYGTSNANAVAALQAALGNPALAAGLKLTVPQTLSYASGPATATANNAVLSTTMTNTVPPYYTVVSTDDWTSITQKVYGTTNANAVAALQSALGNPALTAGLKLTVPQTLSYNVSTASAANSAALSTTITQIQTVTVTPYYAVLGTDTWTSITQKVYGTTQANAVAALQAALGNPVLTAGLKLTMPQTLSYSAPVSVTVQADIVDPLLQMTSLFYDGAGQIVRALTPAVGGTRLETRYAYDAQGNVMSVTDARGNVVTYGYDARGNRTSERDSLGDTVERVFGAKNEVLAETTYSAVITSVASSTGETWTLQDKARIEGTPPYLSLTGLSGTYASTPDSVANSVTGDIEFVMKVAPDSWTSGTQHIIAKRDASGQSYVVRLVPSGSSAKLEVLKGTPDGTSSWSAQSSVIPGTVAGQAKWLKAQIDVDNGLGAAVFNFFASDDGVTWTSIGTSTVAGAAGPIFNGTSPVEIGSAFSGSDRLFQGEIYYADIRNGLGGPIAAKFDPGAGVTRQAVAPLTTRYVYDTKNHLRFAVGAEGRVTEYRYNGFGQAEAAIQYTGALYNLSGLTPGSTLTETQLTAWLPLDKSASVRSNTAYDFRGQVKSVTTFDKVNAQGDGIADGSQAQTLYVYDQAGNLVQTVDPRGVAAGNPGAFTTTYAYDGLGRLRIATDAAQRVTLTDYDDAGRKTVVTLANNLVSTSTYDATGRLVSVIQSAGGAGLGETKYFYDADGRPRRTEDPTGVRTHILYDEASRRIGEIDGDGSLTEYRYDAAGNLTRTIRYANPVSAAGLSSLVAADGKPTNVALAAIRPNASIADRSTWRVYDAANRLIKSVDEAGAVTQYFYDAADHLKDVLRYATTIATGTLGDAPAAGSIGPVLSADDRLSRSFYDAEGRVRGTLDGEGSLVEYKYDAAGQLVETVGYANLTSAGARITGTLAQLVPAASANDLHSYTLYNARGQVAGTVDAEGFLTETVYDAAGNKVRIVRYATKVAYTAGATVASLRPAANAQDRASVFVYDALGRLASDTNAEGTVTQYFYDQVDNLTKKVKAVGATEVRTLTAQFDKLGRVTAELPAKVAAQLTGNETQAQIDAIWAANAVKHAYDLSGRRTSTTAANGKKMLFYYDADRRLTHTINAAGEVTQSVYDAFGQLTQTIAYGTRLAAATLAALTGGLVNDTLKNAVAAIANAQLDSRTAYGYGATGALTQITDAGNNLTTQAFNAFGDLATRIQAIGDGRTLEHRYGYDRRGLLTLTRWDPTGVDEQASTVYDAFGRAVQTTDARGNVRTFGYDRLGRVVVTRDPFNIAKVATYDAFDRVLTQADALGKVTTYSYNTADRSVTVTTPENIATTTFRNRHGETVSVRDGRGNITSYEYDPDGNLTRVTDPSGATAKAYDNADLLIETTDAAGTKTAYLYDAANRVSRRTVDSGAGRLNLVTTYAYDAKGQTVDVTDPNGVLTRTTYDLKGQVKQVAIDPTGLNLRTTYDYDGRGKVLTLTEGAGSSQPRVTQYAYDKLGRLTSEQLDPAGINATTTYVYDKNDNVTKKTDALGNVTRYAYDAADRMVYTVDALGGVTKTDYDAAGRVVRVTAYATPIGLANLSDTPSLADISGRLTPSTALDHIKSYVYDGDGREIYCLDALGAVTQKFYDANGNMVREVRYAKTIAVPATLTKTAVDAAIVLDPVNDRTTRTVYDAANRVIFTIDPEGFVSQRVYDNVGNVFKATRYANALQGSFADNVAPQIVTVAPATGSYVILNPANDQITRYAYDAAGRETSCTHGEGTTAQYTETYAYDAVGNAIRHTDGRGNSEWSAFDRAGRLTRHIDAMGFVEDTTYDAVGNVQDRTTYMNAVPLPRTPDDRYAYNAPIPVITGSYAPKQLQANENQFAAAPVVAYAADGSGFMAWLESDGARNNVYVNRYVAGSGWLGATPVETDSNGSAVSSVQLAVNAADDAVVVWQYSEPGQGMNIWANYYIHGQGWQGAQRIEAPGGNATLAKVVIDAAGNATAVWGEGGGVGGPSTFLTNRYVRGLGWQTAQTVAVSSQYGIAGDAAGNVFVVWGGAGINGGVWLTQYRASQGWQPATQIGANANPGSSPFAPTIAVDAAGNAVVAWSQADANGIYNIYTRRFVVGQGWLGVEVVATNTGLFPVLDLSLSVNGTALITWTQVASLAGMDADVLAVYYVPGQGWQAPAPINATSAFTPTSVQTGIDANGNAIVAWVEKEGSDISMSSSHVWVRRYLAGQGWQTAVQLAQFGASTSKVKLAADMDAAGDVLVSWDGYIDAAESQRRIFAYDAVRNDGEVVRAFGSAVSVTHYVYDALGRLTEETSGFGTMIAATTRYGLDVLGNRKTIVDPRGVELAEQDTAWALETRKTLGYVDAAGNAKKAAALTIAEKDALRARYTTTQQFDALGRKKLTIDALGNQTSAEYDAFGNLVKGTDARGSVGYFYFDRRNRVVLQVDPESYVVETAYDAFDNVKRTTRYGNKAVGAISAVAPPKVAIAAPASGPYVLVDPGHDQATLFDYDRRDLKKRVQDAAGFAEIFQYDARGNVVNHVDKNGNVCIYEYDALDRKIAERQPITSSTGGTPVQVVNRWEYDAQGNRTKEILAQGLPEERVTQYVYDANGRLIQTIEPKILMQSSVPSGGGGLQFGAGGTLRVTATLNTLGSTFDAPQFSASWPPVVGFGDGNIRVVWIVGDGQVIQGTVGAGATGISLTAAAPTVFPSLFEVQLWKQTPAGEVFLGGQSGGGYQWVLTSSSKILLFTFNQWSSTTDTTLASTLQFTGQPAGGRAMRVAYWPASNRDDITEIDLPPSFMPGTFSAVLAGALSGNYEYDARVFADSGEVLSHLTGTFSVVNGAVTTNVVGQPLITGMLWNPVESKSYDARGNVLTETDAKGNVTHHYYDANNRAIAWVDAERYLHVVTYDAAGNAVALRTYDDRLPDWADLSVLPNPGAITGMNASSFRETRYRYDANNRVVETRSPDVQVFDRTNGFRTQSLVNNVQYDATGNLVLATDANRNKTYFFYDKVGNRIAQVDALGYFTAWTADAEGNIRKQTKYATALSAATLASLGVSSDPQALIAQVQAANNPDDRVTTYEYDFMNRKVRETVFTRYSVIGSTPGSVPVNGLMPEFPTVAVTGESPVTTQTFYDGMGNLMVKIAADGGRTDYTYDGKNRLVRQQDPAFTDASLATVRTTTEFAYDGIGHLLTKTEKGTTQDAVTSYIYDPYGNVTGQTDPVGNPVTYYYDLNGNITVKHTRRLNPDGTQPAVDSLYTYDRLNRQVKTQDALNFIDFVRYDAHGEIVAKGLNGLDQEYFEYDRAGRLVKSNQGDGVDRAYLYDADGNETARIQSSVTDTDLRSLSLDQVVALSPAVVQVTQSEYDARDQLVRTFQAPMDVDNTTGTTGVKHVFLNSLNDPFVGGTIVPAAAGTVNFSFRSGTGGWVLFNGPPYSLTHLFVSWPRIDGYGDGNIRVVWQQSDGQTRSGAVVSGATSILLDLNANPDALASSYTVWVYKETDQGDILIATSSGAYQWAMTFTTGDDAPLGGFTNYEASAAASTPSLLHFTGQRADAASMKLWLWPESGTQPATPVPVSKLLNAAGHQVDGHFVFDWSGLAGGTYRYEFKTFDIAGKELDHVQGKVFLGALPAVLSEEIDTLQPDSTTAPLPVPIVRSQTYNAFGEVASETDGRGNVTKLFYDRRGNLVLKTDPATNIRVPNGTLMNFANSFVYYYDIVGRPLGTTDFFNGVANLVAQQYDIAGHRITELHADGGKRTFAYNVLGDMVSMRNEVVEVTKYSYDRDHRLIQVDRPTGPVGFNSLPRLDTYKYDEAGRRILHTNALGLSEFTYYDDIGRVKATWTSGLVPTRYRYIYAQSTGGTTTITTTADGRTLEDTTNYFGRLVRHKDLGGRIFDYTYNKAGWLTHQTGSNGQDITFEYYQNGYLKNVIDAGVGTRAHYEYDKNGNRTFEGYSGPGGVVYQLTTATYDELNRVTAVSDPRYSISYEYDALGNREHVVATYKDLLNGNPQVQEYWYAYDTMNRIRVAKGSLDATLGRVVPGTNGYEIFYDLAGQRWHTKYTENGAPVDESYFWEGGMLVATFLTAPSQSPVRRSQRLYDRVGNVTSYWEFAADGNTISRYVGRSYNGDSRLMNEFTNVGDTTVSNSNYAYDKAGNLLSVTTDLPGGTRQTTSYFYDYWDTAKQLQIRLQSTNPNVGPWAPGFSNFTYDKNGHLTQVRDEVMNRQLSNKLDADGRVLQRNELTIQGASRTQNYYYLNGVGIGDSGSYGTLREDYATQLSQHEEEDYYSKLSADLANQPQGGGRLLDRMRDVLKQVQQQPQRPSLDAHNADLKAKRGQPVSSADFDYNFEPINDQYPATTPGTFTVRNGDTLRTVAFAVWGDSSLWYLLADANGLESGAHLTTGQILTIPNVVTNIHNNASTVRVYNPGGLIGDTTPTLPDPPPPPRPKDGDNCGGFGQILVIVVSIVVTYYFGSVAGNLAGQIVGNIAGTQRGLNVGSLIGSYIGGQIGFDFGNEVANSAAAAGAGNAIGQGINIATGYQDKFNWASVATSAIAAPIAQGISNAIQGSYEFEGLESEPTTADYQDRDPVPQGFGSRWASAFAASFTRAAVGSLITGKSQFDFADMTLGSFGDAAQGYLRDGRRPERQPEDEQGASVTNTDGDYSNLTPSRAFALTDEELHALSAKLSGMDARLPEYENELVASGGSFYEALRRKLSAVPTAESVRAGVEQQTVGTDDLASAGASVASDGEEDGRATAAIKAYLGETPEEYFPAPTADGAGFQADMARRRAESLYRPDPTRRWFAENEGGAVTALNGPDGTTRSRLPMDLEKVAHGAENAAVFGERVILAMGTYNAQSILNNAYPLHWGGQVGIGLAEGFDEAASLYKSGQARQSLLYSEGRYGSTVKMLGLAGNVLGFIEQGAYVAEAPAHLRLQATGAAATNLVGEAIATSSGAVVGTWVGTAVGAPFPAVLPVTIPAGNFLGGMAGHILYESQVQPRVREFFIPTPVVYFP